MRQVSNRDKNGASRHPGSLRRTADSVQCRNHDHIWSSDSRLEIFFKIQRSAVEWSKSEGKTLSLSLSLYLFLSLSHHKDEDVIKIKNIKKVWLVLKD